jgi:pimeloyl-ACP methyl ester carboxylesterase
MERLTLNAKPQVKTAVMNGIRRISKEASINIIRNIFEYDPLPALSAYPGPKLIVSSTMEKANPAALSKQLPDIPHQEIPGTSHWIQMDKPDEFNTILEQFLRGIR